MQYISQVAESHKNHSYFTSCAKSSGRIIDFPPPSTLTRMNCIITRGWNDHYHLNSSIWSHNLPIFSGAWTGTLSSKVDVKDLNNRKFNSELIIIPSPLLPPLTHAYINSMDGDVRFGGFGIQVAFLPGIYCTIISRDGSAIC